MQSRTSEQPQQPDKKKVEKKREPDALRQALVMSNLFSQLAYRRSQARWKVALVSQLFRNLQ